MTKVHEHHDEDLNVFEVWCSCTFFYAPEKRDKSSISFLIIKYSK